MHGERGTARRSVDAACASAAAQLACSIALAHRLPRPLAPLQNLIFRFLQSRQKIQIWLYDHNDLRIEGRIIVRAWHALFVGRWAGRRLRARQRLGARRRAWCRPCSRAVQMS